MRSTFALRIFKIILFRSTGAPADALVLHFYERSRHHN